MPAERNQHLLSDIPKAHQCQNNNTKAFVLIFVPIKMHLMLSWLLVFLRDSSAYFYPFVIIGFVKFANVHS